jgi:hypothetical protein
VNPFRTVFGMKFSFMLCKGLMLVTEVHAKVEHAMLETLHKTGKYTLCRILSVKVAYFYTGI